MADNKENMGPEEHTPPGPPPRPVEEGKTVYLKLSELHAFHHVDPFPAATLRVFVGNPRICRTSSPSCKRH